jgi:hypothetical protein
MIILFGGIAKRSVTIICRGLSEINRARKVAPVLQQSKSCWVAYALVSGNKPIAMAINQRGERMTRIGGKVLLFEPFNPWRLQ